MRIPQTRILEKVLYTTFQKMKEFGLKEPQIVEDKNYVRVTVPHTPLAAPTEGILSFLELNPQNNQQAGARHHENSL